MFSIMRKDLKNMFEKQRLLSLLLVLNIVVSCLVICFSYGLYQNYHQTVATSKAEEEITSLSVFVDNDDRRYIDEYQVHTASDTTPQMVVNMVRGLSDETKANLTSVEMALLIETPLADVTTCISAEEANDYMMPQFTPENTEDYYYSDDASADYKLFLTAFHASGNNIVDSFGDKFFTTQQYAAGEKAVVVSQEMFSKPVGEQYLIGGKFLDVRVRTLPEDTKYILIGGEKYRISKVVPYDEMPAIADIMIPITAIPDNAQIHYTPGDNDTRRTCFRMYFDKPVTHSQYEDIKKCVSTFLADTAVLQEIRFTDVTQLQYYRTVMLISVVIAVLAAINMAILYRYILEKRTSQLAIMRICGCTKGKAIISYLLECMVINMPLFALTELIYHKLIMPRLALIFPEMSKAYSFKLYVAVFGLYVGASLAVMLIMIISTVRKHSLKDMKNAHRTSGRSPLMKFFEIIQIAAVLSMMIFIVSAISSRYSMYAPFEKYIESKGYMTSITDLSTYPEDLEKTVGDAKYLSCQWVVAIDGDKTIEGIAYPDEIFTAYKPPLAQGVWLTDTDITYEKDGCIPVVVTSCEGRYKVGDTISYDVTMSYNEVTGEPDKIVHAEYKVVGVLKDKASVAGFFGSSFELSDYNALYGTFVDSFEDNDWFLSKISDEYACYGSNAPLCGVQLVLCDNMTDEQYEQIGNNLYTAKIPSIKLSQVRKNSMQYIYEQMYTLFPIAVCIFILTIISTVSISAIYTKRQLRNYAIFYICGARWRTCALRSLKNSAITCGIASILAAAVLIIGKMTLLKETVISFGWWHFGVCAGVIALYLALSMIMPLAIIGSNEPKEVLKEE